MFGLQPAFHIHHLFKIYEALCKKNPEESPEEQHVQLEGTSKTVVSSNSKALYCPLYKERELELYCETCEELICVLCTVSAQLHRGHQYDMVNSLFKKHKREITASLEPVDKQLSTVIKALEQLEKNVVSRSLINEQLLKLTFIKPFTGYMKHLTKGKQNSLVSKFS